MHANDHKGNLPSQSRTKQEVTQFFDSKAEPLDQETWYAAYGSPHHRFSKASYYFDKRRVTEALKLSGINRDARVLEVGCSFGHQTAMFAAHFPDLTAADISPKSIKVAKARFKRYNLDQVRFVTADVENLETFEDRSFDAIYSFSTLGYCPNVRRALSELYRVCSKDARVVVDFPNRNCPWYGPIKMLLGIQTRVYEHYFSRKEAVELLRTVGFEQVRPKYLSFIPRMVPDKLFLFFRLMDIVFEKLPLLRSLAGTIMVTGLKVES